MNARRTDNIDMHAELLAVWNKPLEHYPQFDDDNVRRALGLLNYYLMLPHSTKGPYYNAVYNAVESAYKEITEHRRGTIFVLLDTPDCAQLSVIGLATILKKELQKNYITTIPEDSGLYEIINILKNQAQINFSALSITNCPIDHHRLGMDTNGNSVYMSDKKIGTGTFGTVYFGLWHEKRIAIKKIDPTKRSTPEKSMSEIVSINKLKRANTPNIVDCYFTYATTYAKCFYIGMEYLVNGSLYKYIRDHKQPSMDICFQILSNVVASLDFIFCLGLLYNDIKSENILLDENLNAKICDFGFMCGIKEAVENKTLYGTPQYMAPELFRREHNTIATEIFSLGTLALEITRWSVAELDGYATINFKQPRNDIYAEFIKLHERIVREGKEKERGTIPADCDPYLKELIERCWPHDPTKRISMAEIKTLLFNSRNYLKQHAIVSAEDSLAHKL